VEEKGCQRTGGSCDCGVMEKGERRGTDTMEGRRCPVLSLSGYYSLAVPAPVSSGCLCSGWRRRR